MAKQYGMVIDTTRCMGCQTCAVACKVSNEVPGDIYWAHVEGLDGDVYRPTGTFPQSDITGIAWIIFGEVGSHVDCP